MIPGDMMKVQVWRILMVSALMFVAALLPLGCAAPTPVTRKPNIVFVMTDDMPERLLHRMPEVHKRIVDRGLRFPNAYISESVCAPSRASILTGMYPHNTGVWMNGQPPYLYHDRESHGGLKVFREEGLEEHTVATWLEKSGYRTGLIGKYMNGYDASYVPPGWAYWAGRDTAGSGTNENGNVRDYSGQFMTDVYKDKALAFLKQATDRAGDPPFALFVWTNAPHLPPEYAARHADLYEDEVLNPPPSFDEADVSDKPQWIRELPRLSDEDRLMLSEWHRNQRRSLRAVDEMVGAILDLLQQRGVLGNTYVVFTTDNGTHMGEHRWWKESGAKHTAYEEAAGVPLAVRGPGVPAGEVRSQLVLNNDFAPTFADIAGAHVPKEVDGRSLLPLMEGKASSEGWRTALLNERPLAGGYQEGRRIPIPAYHALITNRYTYVEYETGERELYNRQEDPYQLESIHKTADPALLQALHARVMTLKACAGKSCEAAENGP
jgi:N-acetylglucosamine-6-sulfatase